jgi:hypothetical protein
MRGTGLQAQPRGATCEKQECKVNPEDDMHPKFVKTVPKGFFQIDREICCNADPEFSVKQLPRISENRIRRKLSPGGDMRETG